MKTLLLLFGLCLPAFSQCTLTTFVNGTTIHASAVNANFTSLNTCKTNRYSGSSVPGNIASSRLGDLYTRTGTTEAYMCFAAGPCTAVASGNWVLLGTGSSGGGTVTVFLGGVLSDNAVVVGAGFQRIKTPSNLTRIDAAGNFTTPGFIETGVTTSDPGSILLNRTSVSGLPTCQANAEGTRMSVNDATATTFYSVVAGGGSNHVPVFCDGTDWRIG